MKFFRYLAVQVSAYGLDIGTFGVLCKIMGIGPLYANVVAKVLSGIVCFWVHRSFTFDVSDNSSRWKQAVSYFSLLALNIPFSSMVLSIVMGFVSHEIFAKFFSDVICVAVTYGLSKRFVFEKTSKKKSGDSVSRRGA